MKKLLLTLTLTLIARTAFAAAPCGAYADFSALSGSSNLYTAMNGKLNIQCGNGPPALLAGTAWADAYVDEVVTPGNFYIATVTGAPATWALIGSQTATAMAGKLASTTFVYGLPLTGASFPAVRGYGLASGDVDLYTVPAGKRLLVIGSSGYNSTAGAITWYPELKSTSGSYYRLNTSVVGNSLSGISAISISIVLEAGESISFNSSAPGLNVTMDTLLFDNTSPFRTVKLLGLATGNNTLYTVPAGKTALTNPTTLILGGTGLLTYVGDAGGPGTVNTYIVPSGGTAGPGNLVSVTVGAAFTRMIAAFNGSLAAGDSGVMNVATGGTAQIAWSNIFEF
jgi:hypothetical protein